MTGLSGELGFCFINVIQQVGAGSHGDSSITADTLCICGLHLGSMNVHTSQSSAPYASSYFGFPQILASFFPRHVYLCTDSLAQDTPVLSDWSASSKCALVWYSKWAAKCFWVSRTAVTQSSPSPKAFSKKPVSFHS